MSTIGLLASTEKTVKLGRMHMRPFQWHLKTHWKYLMPLDTLVPWNQKMIRHEEWWLDPQNGPQGEYLHPKEHMILKLIFTDASNAGWGAHSGQNSTGGLWSLSEKHLHINLHIRARHVPGLLNVIADGLSRRNQIQSTEGSLSPQIFKQVSKIWESPSGPVHNQPEQKTSCICLSDSGSSGMGSRCPQHSMGKHGCLRVPSHCPAARGCTKTSIRNMQDNSDSPTKLADKTMVLGPGGDVSGYSKTTTMCTHTHSAKTTTEQPIPCQPNIPEPPCLVSRSSAVQEHGTTPGTTYIGSIRTL